LNDILPDETIVAYLDGALEPSARARFEARCQHDPALAQRVEAHRWLGAQIVASFGPPPSDEAGDRTLLARLGLAETPVPARALPPGPRFGLARWRRAPRPAAAITALAASLAFGLWLGGLHGVDSEALTVRREGHLVAAGELSRALSDGLSGQPGTIRIAMTIRTAQGPCRTFAADSGLAGLACRTNARWEVPVMVENPAARGPKGEYRLAAGEIPAAVMAEVDKRIVGDPLDARAEQELRQRGWR